MSVGPVLGSSVVVEGGVDESDELVDGLELVGEDCASSDFDGVAESEDLSVDFDLSVSDDLSAFFDDSSLVATRLF